MFGGGFGGCGGSGFPGGGTFGGRPAGCGGYHPGAKRALGGDEAGDRSAKVRPSAITQHHGRGLAAISDGAAEAALDEGPVEKEDDQEEPEDDEVPGGDLETLEKKLASSVAAAKAKAKAAAKEKAAAAKMAKKPAAAEAGVLKKPAAAKSTGPHWGFEESRKQIMCRTGKPGAGQSHAIKYEVVGGKAAAIKLADAWVAKQKKAA